MKQFSKKTQEIARELNELNVKYNDFRKADSEIKSKYGHDAWSKACGYLDYIRSEEYELGC